MIIETSLGQYFVIQIADKWISHIVNSVEIGDYLERGKVFGMIRFGSQVDVFIPDSLGYEPTVEPGIYVHAGKSIIASQII
jgi:phosphatidylserine decarboxylase